MRSRALASLLLATMLAGATAALAQAQQPGGQAQSTSKGVVLKGKAPVNDEVLKVKLPRPREVDLSNGIHLMVLEDRRAPAVSFTLVIPGAGGYYDPADSPGLAAFTAAVMREGTAARSSAQISEQIETMGAFLNITTGMSSLDATVSGSCLTEHLDKLFDLTADVLLHPAFADDELARYKQRTLAQLNQQRSSPNFLAAELYAKVLNGNHPASRIAPGADALSRTTRPALVEFHRTHYAPDHAVIAIAGDISLADARKLVEAKLGEWKKTGAGNATASDPPPNGRAMVHLVARPSSVQTNLIVGTQAIDRTNPDYDVLQMMNKVIGGGPTGRLFVHLREDKGYTYGAYSGLTALRFRGNWNAQTDVRTEVTEPALTDLMAEIARMRDEAVPDKEFRDQRRSMVASFALSLENAQQILNYYITSWLYHLPADYWDRYPERVMAVTPAQVQAAARKYLDPARLQIVAVGDSTKIAPILRKFGSLETYDTEGKPITRLPVP